MKFRIALMLVSAAALAACGSKSGDANGTEPVAAAPVAGKAPPAGKQWSEVVAATPEGGVRMGNPDAPVKLVEFGSRACPFCAQFSANAVPKLVAGPVASGKVSYEFRDYPIHGSLDIAPILLGHCVPTEAFFPMLDAMMAAQPQLLAKAEQVAPAAQALGEPNKIATAFAEQLGYLDFVKQRGLPEAQARQCLSDAKATEAIAQRYEAANKNYTITGTPTLIVNGRNVDLPVGVDMWMTLERALKAAGV